MRKLFLLTMAAVFCVTNISHAIPILVTFGNDPAQETVTSSVTYQGLRATPTGTSLEGTTHFDKADNASLPQNPKNGEPEIGLVGLIISITVWFFLFEFRGRWAAALVFGVWLIMILSEVFLLPTSA